MILKKDTCSICGVENDIYTKVVSNGEALFYCKQCYNNEKRLMLDNFNKIKLVCLKCGSSNINKDDATAGIVDDVIKFNGLTDVTSAMYGNAFITCNDCNHKFFVNMLDYSDTNNADIIYSLNVK